MDEAIDEENCLPSGLDFRTHLNSGWTWHPSGTPAWKRGDGIPRANVYKTSIF